MRQNDGLFQVTLQAIMGVIFLKNFYNNNAVSTGLSYQHCNKWSRRSNKNQKQCKEAALSYALQKFSL